ncbi:hypothetical protein UFOVP257_255 [uncultured Caudovirales phage]|uniref:Uncharacterized protein n=1 Tax=uncultured Caudovirales phage TaxID=2100421 RepID=A0A6J5LJM0_9CAUD|nr:hypothetical protein UFOVP257_255 [uncultured Caudovirales phage]
MPYKFDIAMSAVVNTQVVQEMVITEIEKTVGKKVNKIVATYDGTEFTGYQVFFDADSKTKSIPIKTSKEFVPLTYNN